jgi:signal transduction histidine kinase
VIVALTNAAAWLRERWLWVVFGLIAAVATLAWAWRRERTNRLAAEALAKWERLIAESAARRRVRVTAAEAKRDLRRTVTLRERMLALQRADDRRREIYAAGDDLGELFDRVYRAGRHR